MFRDENLVFMVPYLKRKKGTLMESLCFLSVGLSRPFISGTRGDIDLKLKPFSPVLTFLKIFRRGSDYITDILGVN